LSVSLFRASYFAARRSDWFCFSVPVSLIVFVYCGGLAPSAVPGIRIFLWPVVFIIFCTVPAQYVVLQLFQQLEKANYILSRS
jgi:hypothetical protein